MTKQNINWYELDLYIGKKIEIIGFMLNSNNKQQRMKVCGNLYGYENLGGYKYIHITDGSWVKKILFQEVEVKLA
jgi:hypothetical protein